MIFDISSKTTQISYTYITWFYLCNKESPEQKTLPHFFQYAYVFRKFYLKWLLGRMQWVICDFRINRTPSSVFDWWKHYSVLTYLWMQYVWWKEKGHIGSRKKIRSPCLFGLFTPLLEKREYAEAVSFFLSNQW
jgi:hypothetical protein